MPLNRGAVGHSQRTLHHASRFVDEFRYDIERAVAQGSDTLPRVRSVHEQVGHASPEFRTFSIPVPDDAGGASPTVLSSAIAHFSRTRPAQCLLLGLDLETEAPEGTRSVLIAEARDRAGTRLFWLQPYARNGERVVWGEPEDGGWRDPGDDELILDAAFARSG